VPLTDLDRTRYARHLLLAEIGGAGQERLCATDASAAPDADPRAARWALEYLRRSGVAVRPGGTRVALPSRDGLVKLGGGATDLEEASAALAGAFAAVERIKAVLGAGRPGVLELASLEDPE
jgi:hypothetical protein